MFFFYDKSIYAIFLSSFKVLRSFGIFKFDLGFVTINRCYVLEMLMAKSSSSRNRHNSDKDVFFLSLKARFRKVPKCSQTPILKPQRKIRSTARSSQCHSKTPDSACVLRFSKMSVWQIDLENQPGAVQILQHDGRDRVRRNFRS